MTQHQCFDYNSHMLTLGINPGLRSDYAIAKRFTVERASVKTWVEGVLGRK